MPASADRGHEAGSLVRAGWHRNSGTTSDHKDWIMNTLAAARDASAFSMIGPGDCAGPHGVSPMPDDRGRMTADEFRAALALLGLSQSAFARFLVEMGDAAGDKERTVQRWATGQQDIPGPILVLLKVLAVVALYSHLTPASIQDCARPDSLDAAQIIEDRRKK